MLVLVRFAESDDAAAERLLDDASALLVALTERPGFGGGRLVRSTDLDGGWVLEMEWASMGDWRRAFSPYDLRMQAKPQLVPLTDHLDLLHVVAELVEAMKTLVDWAMTFPQDPRNVPVSTETGSKSLLVF